MQHRVDLAGLKRRGQRGRKRRGDRSVNDRHLRRNAVHDQFGHQIGGAILAGKIKQRRRRIGMTLGDQLHQIAHVATGRSDVGKSRLPRGVGAALADRDQRQLDERCARRVAGDGAGRIGAGDDDPAPGAGKIGLNRLDPQQRRDQRSVSTRAQSGGGAFAIGLRAGDDQAHVIFSCA